MASTIGWELYRTFLSVLKEGSLSGAARSLGITQPTAGRHVAALEKALGLALFTRSPTGLLPTEAALALRPQAEAMESTAASLERTAASDVIGVEVLPPIVGQLRREHPDLEIELALTNQVQDLLRREADIAVRMTPPKQEMLIARRIGKIELGLYATRQYLDEHGVPRNIDDLSKHTVIGFDKENAFIRAARKSLPSLRREMFALRTDNDVAIVALIRAGAGLGVCQVPVARRPGAEPLVRVLSRQISLSLETWITMHEDLRNRPSCQVTFAALVAGLQRHVAAGTA